MSPISQGKAQVRILETLIDIEDRAAEGMPYSNHIDSRWFSGECSVLDPGQPFEFGAPFFGKVRINSLATAELAAMTDLGLSIGAFEMTPSTMNRDLIGESLPQKQLPLGYPGLPISGNLSMEETVSTSCQGSNGWQVSYADCEGSNAVDESAMNF
ncbi:hypothetical protein CEP54_011607 [Fusarium duplospermum]|uniref:Uncharacterized protein n=1 Tax=Fusarium duplospermum TaxID=1325734 RepID=A0A428PDF6_9HYPO|nr:hypothetical protein CEP54_011607 [Fusarium duplospermum]